VIHFFAFKNSKILLIVIFSPNIAILSKVYRFFPKKAITV